MNEPQPAIGRPFLRFDSFGSPEHVLHDISEHVPHIFTDHGDSYARTLKRMVHEAANKYLWDALALIVTQGMAEKELDLFLEHPPLSIGPVIIDPSLLNTQPNIFETNDELKKDRDRLVMLSDGAGEPLVILYGIAAIDHATQNSLIQKRLRMLDETFEMIMVELTPLQGALPWAFDLVNNLKKFQLSRNSLGELTQVIEPDTLENLDPDGNVGGPLYETRRLVSYMMQHKYDPVIDHNLIAAALALKLTADQLALHKKKENAPAPKPIVNKPIHPEPHLHHDHKHDTFDELSPHPKPY
jgi:hypothetical protein